MSRHPVRHWLTELGVLTAHVSAFFIVPLYGLAWLLLAPQSFDWHSIAVLATWFMTLLIQRATHRDTQALHAKLDELLHAQSEASNRLTLIDKEDPEDIEKHRRLARAADRSKDAAGGSRAGRSGDAATSRAAPTRGLPTDSR